MIRQDDRLMRPKLRGLTAYTVTPAVLGQTPNHCLRQGTPPRLESTATFHWDNWFLSEIKSQLHTRDASFALPQASSGKDSWIDLSLLSIILFRWDNNWFYHNIIKKIISSFVFCCRRNDWGRIDSKELSQSSWINRHNYEIGKNIIVILKELSYIGRLQTKLGNNHFMIIESHRIKVHSIHLSIF